MIHQTEGERGRGGRETTKKHWAGVQEKTDEKLKKREIKRGTRRKRMRTTYYVQKKKIGNLKIMTSQQRAPKQK